MPLVFQGGELLFKDGELAMDADCCCTPFDCVTPDAEEPATCAELEACLENMPVSVQFSAGDCNGQDIGGAWFLPDPAAFTALSALIFDKLVNLGCSEDLGCDGGLTISGSGFELILSCIDTDTIRVELKFTAACFAGPPASVEVFRWYEDFELPISVTNSMTFTLTNFSSDSGWSANGNATVRWWGVPCADSDAGDCPSGPIADFLLTATACGYRIVGNASAVACPILACFWSDGSTAGCARDEIESCEDAPNDITMYVVDEGGCWDEVTKVPPCCDCPNLAPVALNIDSCVVSEPTADPDVINCWHRMTANIQCLDPECEDCVDSAFIEVCRFEGLAEEYDCDECQEVNEDPEDNPCATATVSGCITLSHGNSYLWGPLPYNNATLDALDGFCFRWRLWPCGCGCPGPWNYFTIPQSAFVNDNCEPEE